MTKYLTRVWLPIVLWAVSGAAEAAGGPSLIEAVKRGDEAAIKQLSAQPGAAASTDADGTTALHWATYRNDIATVDLLLRAGAPANTGNRYGVRALSLAAENGNALLVQRLLKAGADPESAMPGGETALMTASRTGDVATIQALLAAGANVNAREHTRNQTPLMWAAANGNAAAISALITAGADINARSSTPDKPAASRSMGAARRARPTSSASTIPYGAYTALIFAARRGHLDAVRALLDGGASVNDGAVAEPGSGPTPVLTFAVANGHYELATYLLDRGADPNLAGNGWTALHQLARARSEPGKTRTNLGWTPGPTMTGRVSGLEFARRWVAKGGQVNARATKDFEDGYRHAEYLNRVNATPLVMAARVSDYQLIQTLIALGADPTLAGDDGITPLMCAAGNGIRSPAEDGGDDDAPRAVEVLMAALRERGVDLKAAVNQADERGWTPLHGAAYRGIPAVIQLLVDAGAQLDAKTYDAGRARTDLGLSTAGWMPVHVADGIVVGGIFFRQVAAAALLRTLMAERGLPVPTDEGLVRGTYNDNSGKDSRLLREKAEGQKP